MPNPLLVATLLGCLLCPAGRALAQQLQWRELAPIAVPECQLVFDAARDRFVAVADRTLEWDGTDWRLRRTAHAPPPRTEFGLAYDGGRARTVLFGGRDAGAVRGDLWEYDGFDWVQRTAGGGPPARSGPALAFDPLLGGVVVFGGHDGSQAVGDTWLWYGTGWVSVPGPGPSARARAAMAFHAATGRLVLFGGDNGSSETWTLTSLNWVHESPATVPPPRSHHRVCADAANSVVRMFGDDDPQSWEWNGTDWSVEGVGPEPRRDCGFAASDRGATMVFAGTQHLPVPGLPTQVTRPCSDTWLRDTTGWHRLRAPPPTLVDVALAYDLSRDRVVCCGATADNQFPQPTREWDGERWHEIAGSQLPWSTGFRICHDFIRGRTVRFGGLAPSAAFFAVIDDLREWDGTAWIRQTAVGPPARWSHAMVFEPLRGVVLLFGGSNISSFLRDTWQWDGIAWTQLASSGPSGRMMHALACDLQRGRTVLFGGYGAAGVLGDTWEWDGLAWTARATAQAPTPRRWCCFDYDQRRQRCVLLGGQDAANTPSLEQWEWDGVQWTGGPSALPDDAASAGDAAVVYRGDQWFRVAGAGAWLGGSISAAAVATGSGCGSAAAPALAAFGEPVLGLAHFALELGHTGGAAPFALGLAAGHASAPLPGNCTLYLPALDLLLFGIASNAFASIPLAVPAQPAWLGLHVTAQAALLDPAAPLGLALSNAVELTVGY